MPYKLKVFQLIKTVVCTFCFHLLKIAGCIEQTSKAFKNIQFWVYSLEIVTQIYMINAQNICVIDNT